MKDRAEPVRSVAEIAIVPGWPAPGRVRAYSTLRIGGVSGGGYSSLNLGAHVGDDPANVAANRRRVAERLCLPAKPHWLEQVHGTHVLDLDSEFGSDRVVHPDRDLDRIPDPDLDRIPYPDPSPNAGPDRDGERDIDNSPELAPDMALVPVPPPADAAVTSRSGAVCVVLTADCVPVLLADRRGRRVGAAHAGWRGLAHGVLSAAVDALRLPPEDLLAWLGPAIGPRAFEVGDEVRAAFAERGFTVDRAFVRNKRGRWHADLYALAAQALSRAGVTAIYGGEHCTFTEADRFFSHRREAPCGRMASMIWLI